AGERAGTAPARQVALASEQRVGGARRRPADAERPRQLPLGGQACPQRQTPVQNQGAKSGGKPLVSRSSRREIRQQSPYVDGAHLAHEEPLSLDWLWIRGDCNANLS